MNPDDRREQLLDIGAQLFARLPYEDVVMTDVATRAGVTRALVYRYFPTKRDFFAAIFQQASDRLLRVTVLDPAESLMDQVVAGLDAHLDYFVDNARTLLVANRGALSGDPVVQAIISTELATLRARLLDVLGLAGRQRAVASVALNGWLSFVRAVTMEWLADQSVMSRAELRDLCLRTLLAALDTQPG
jgi:AcrR family transcriptional regulator